MQFEHSDLCFTYVLGHIDMSATGAANTDTDVVGGHVFLGDGTGSFGERGREHHEQVVCVLIAVWKYRERGACTTIAVDPLPPPPMILRMSSIQSGDTISSASSMIVYLGLSAGDIN